jgi:hypothetical protein
LASLSLFASLYWPDRSPSSVCWLAIFQGTSLLGSRRIPLAAVSVRWKAGRLTPDQLSERYLVSHNRNHARTYNEE